MGSSKYYKNIDLIRLLACIAVFLYHLNILKGGYLAVCVFFVLSGYLSCVSALKKEKFSIISYYFNRLKRVYLPLIVVVFISVAVISFFSNINWFNLKPETTSVLLGYNNFWQLGANLDYFARHVNSPFIHLWYIAILLQFDLVFPFLILILRKIGDRFNKVIPCVVALTLSILFTIYFYYMNLNSNIMVTYYNTFTRLFSLLLGLSLGLIHSYYKNIIPNRFNNKKISTFIFSIYSVLLIILFVFVDAQSSFFSIGMIISSLIACRLIDYGTLIVKNNLNKFEKTVKFFSDISYEIYLVQYPIIFLFQYINVSKGLYYLLIFSLVIFISYVLHFSHKFNGKLKIFKILLCIVIYSVVSYGFVQFVIAKDYTLEMKKLEQQLAQNQDIIKKNQEDYESKIEEEKAAWDSILSDIENGEKELENIVTNLSIVGIGDSVMLGAVKNLYDKFPNSYIDAAISRTAWVAGGLLQDLENRNKLGNTILFNLGANGDCSDECKRKVIEKCGNRKIFWVNVTNDKEVHVNDELELLANEYDNLYIIDWNSISKGHSEYFLADRIHLTEIGRKKYVEVIYDAIYEVYLNEYRNKKEQIINDYNENIKQRITFYGNGILLNAFNNIENIFKDSRFVINKDFDYETLKKDIESSKLNNTLNNRIVFAFDSSTDITIEQYQELIKLCEDHQIYILLLNNKIFDINNSNVEIINFYNEIQNNPSYLMADKIHLTDEANIAFGKMLEQNLKIK